MHVYSLRDDATHRRKDEKLMTQLFFNLVDNMSKNRKATECFISNIILVTQVCDAKKEWKNKLFIVGVAKSMSSVANIFSTQSP